MNELSLITAVASVIMAGIFFTFSSFVMTALGNLQACDGIRAMQRINIDVFNWSFAFLFFGIPLAAVVLGIYAVINWSESEAPYYLVGSIVYLFGSLVVTGLRNVPLNDMLARIDPDEDNAVKEWRRYLISWKRWNHVRTGACLTAGLLFASVSFV